MTTVLIIEDDQKITELLKLYCEQEGYRAITSETGPDGLQLAQEANPDVILLDRMLPGMEGLDILRELRKTHQTPVLILSAKSDEIERVVGLELGADDYISKPFSPKEVMARIKAILRRSQSVQEIQSSIHEGKLEINPEKMSVKLDGETLTLSALEFKFLHLLASHPGRVYSRDQLMELLYDSKALVYDRTIDAHIKNIRKKLGDNPKTPLYIQSVFGVGYKFKEQS
ncbi:MAG: two-component system alkaline phosphatase synthesis response regulator PhoP [Oceanicoccus sp.]|jgi:two-component system alkaline phosphatase synthesis response regulator PhoP